jgi:Glutathione peroxidase
MPHGEAAMRALISLVSVIALFLSAPAQAAECPAFLDHDLRKLHSPDSVNLCELSAGKPLLVVNTASRCGFTGQFEGLEQVHQEYRDKGLVVVGFASDDFRQEADSEAEAAKVCFINFGVTFTMIAPTSVTGDAANPVFAALNRQSSAPGWNFFKYVVNSEGRVVARFSSQVSPQDQSLRTSLDQVVSSN